MAIRNVEAPKRSRRSKFNFSAEEVEQASTILAEGGTPGDGGYDTLKEARSAAQALKRSIEDTTEFEGDAKISTQGWEDDKGKGHFALVLKDPEGSE